MIRLRFLFLACLLVLPAWATPECLTLAFQGNVGGKIENCGCPKKPLGGLEHRAALLGELGENCEHMLLIDPGNLLGADDFEGGLAQTKLLLEESRRMGYRVLGVGEREFAFGVDFARSLTDDYGFVLVASNLLYEGASPFATTHVEQVGSLRVGFLSILDAAELPHGFTLEDPAVALAEHLPELRQQSDVTVLLSNLERGDTRRLLRDLPADHGIDFAIEGQTRDHWERAHEVNGVRLLAANAQGKYLGELRLTLLDGAWSGDSTFALHAIERDSPADEQVQARVEEFVAERERLATAGPGR